jgi:hypothetical protein
MNLVFDMLRVFLFLCKLLNIFVNTKPLSCTADLEMTTLLHAKQKLPMMVLVHRFCKRTITAVSIRTQFSDVTNAICIDKKINKQTNTDFKGIKMLFSFSL